MSQAKAKGSSSERHLEIGQRFEDDRTILRHALTIWIAVAGIGCTRAPGLEYQPAASAIGPYSGAVLTEDHIFVSGKIGRGGGFEAEAHTALDAVESELSRAGASLADLVSVTVYLTDMQNYARFNEIYASRIPPPYPARTVVAVNALPASALVEIQAIARRK